MSKTIFINYFNYVGGELQVVKSYAVQFIKCKKSDQINNKHVLKNQTETRTATYHRKVYQM